MYQIHLGAYRNYTLNTTDGAIQSSLNFFSSLNQMFLQNVVVWKEDKAVIFLLGAL